jgi:hypothetical protein
MKDNAPYRATRYSQCAHCGQEGISATEATASVMTIDALGITTAISQLVSSVATRAAGGAMTAQYHLTSDGGRLVSTGFVHADGNTGSVHLQGSIGPIPYDLEITISLDLSTRSISARLQIKQPIQFDHTWIYHMNGAVPVSDGLAVSSLTLVPGSGVQAMVNLDWWCVLKCGGVGILGCLVKCLPALISGGGYVACVVGCAGEAAAGIAVCVGKSCIK